MRKWLWAQWVKRLFVGIKPEDLDERMSSSRNILAKDRFDQTSLLFENDFALRWFADKYPDVELEEKMWFSKPTWLQSNQVGYGKSY